MQAMSLGVSVTGYKSLLLIKKNIEHLKLSKTDKESLLSLTHQKGKKD